MEPWTFYTVSVGVASGVGAMAVHAAVPKPRVAPVVQRMTAAARTLADTDVPIGDAWRKARPAVMDAFRVWAGRTPALLACMGVIAPSTYVVLHSPATFWPTFVIALFVGVPVGTELVRHKYPEHRR